MIADTWLLLSLRWQIAWNSFRSRKPVVKVLSILGVLWLGGIGVVTSGGLGFGAGVALRRFPESHLDTLIPGVILTAVGLIVLLSSFGMALGSLFLSRDLDLLMTAPVSRRAVFLSKLLEGMLLNYAIVFATAVPALVTYGIGLGYGPLYYVLALVAVIGTPLLPSGLGAILVMLVARFAPAQRVREVLGLMGALFGISCAVLSNTSRLWFAQIRPGPDTSPNTVLDTLRGVANLPIPSLVAGRGLSAAGVGDLSGAAVGMAGFLALTFGFFAGCVWLADSLYSSGWVRMQSSGSAKRSKQRAAQVAANRGLLGRASAPVAIMLKDWRVIPRDLRNFAQMLAPAVLLPIIYFNLISGGAGRPGRNPFAGANFANPGGVDLTGLYVAGGVLVTCTLLFARIAAISIGMEGKSWWILKAAPISGAELLRAKFLAALIPFAIVSSILMLGAEVWKGFNPAWFLYGWFGVEVLGAGLLAIETGFSVPWARLDWDDPRRMTSGWGTILSWVGWLVLVVVSGGLLCLPLLAQAFRPSFVPEAALLGGVLAALASAGVGWLVLRFGLSRLDTVGES